MSRRIERVNSLLKKELSEVIQHDVKDPRIGFVTITNVECTADLSIAKVFFEVHGSEEQIQLTRRVLEGASGFLRGKLGERVRLRFIPKLIFKYDDSLEKFEKIEKLLGELKNEEFSKKPQ